MRPPDHPDRSRLQRRALRLEYGTIAGNVGEAVLTISLGVAAGSLALIGFGTDSTIEVFASSVVVWHLRPGHEVDRPERTRLALNAMLGWRWADPAAALVVAIAAANEARENRNEARRPFDAP